MVTTLRKRCAARYAALVGLLLAFLLLPAVPAAASGAIWLPTQQVTLSPTNKSVPSMATYRNHAYILWLGDPVGTHSYYQVYYTTNASGTWQTRLLSAVGPGFGGAGDGPRALIAVDPTIKRLYAAWPVGAGLALYTSDNEGTTWQGPAILVKTSTIKIFPDIALAADKGKVAVAFDGDPTTFGIKPPCPGGVADVLAVTYNGTAWSALQDATSCVSVQSSGFRTQRLAYDETTRRFSLVALDNSGKYRLWYTQSSGTTWSTPTLTPMTQLVTGSGNFYSGDYRVAAAGGTTYVAYANLIKPGAAWCCVDVYLGTYRSGQGWAVQRVTQDPLNCQKFDLALAAVPDRLALAYRWGGFCAKPEPPTGPHTELIHVLTGLPGHFREAVVFQPKPPTNCLRPDLSTDGNVFRVLQVCYNVGVKGVNLFYTPEFLDVVGPDTHITATSETAPGSIRVAWTAQDPTPGSGVAYAEVEVRTDGGAWQIVAAATPSSFIVYPNAKTGHTYTFRVRSRDKVNNWGAWVTATLHAT